MTRNDRFGFFLMKKTLWNVCQYTGLRVVSYGCKRMKRKKDTNFQVYQAVR